MDKDTAASRENRFDGGTCEERYNKKQAAQSRFSGFLHFVVTITKVRRDAPISLARAHQRVALEGRWV
ncbi:MULTISPECIES: hypothetical protein [unclassified Janthinobacterium]|uniref:hypothetical protein n=1 Tax=unclassified Janthinobacterium TaxID=2610881 RepID=UPI0012ECA8F9|nr:MULTISPECIES: hypothetical protein [unclassified Janthinobacterium]MDN2708563.1 hypothetical protein [Janthinobacterium sp. SUN118]